MKLQLWIVDHKQFLFRQNYVQTIIWILCKLRYFQSKITFAKKTKEKKGDRFQMQDTSTSLFLSQWFQEEKKRLNTQCFPQEDMDKPYPSPRQKKLWLHQENPMKQKVTACWAAQDSWSWAKPLANNPPAQPVFVFCTVLDKDRHPQVLLCCNSFIQATEKSHQVHKGNSLFLSKTGVSYSQ